MNVNDALEKISKINKTFESIVNFVNSEKLIDYCLVKNHESILYGDNKVLCILSAHYIYNSYVNIKSNEIGVAIPRSVYQRLAIAYFEKNFYSQYSSIISSVLRTIFGHQKNDTFLSFDINIVLDIFSFFIEENRLFEFKDDIVLFLNAVISGQLDDVVKIMKDELDNLLLYIQEHFNDEIKIGYFGFQYEIFSNNTFSVLLLDPKVNYWTRNIETFRGKILEKLFLLSVREKKLISFHLVSSNIRVMNGENINSVFTSQNIITICRSIFNGDLIKNFKLKKHNGFVYVFGKRYHVGYYPTNLTIAKNIQTIYRDYFTGVEYMYKINGNIFCICQECENGDSGDGTFEPIYLLIQRFVDRFECSSESDIKRYQQEDRLLYQKTQKESISKMVEMFSEYINKGEEKLRKNISEMESKYNQLIEAQILLRKSIEETKTRLELEVSYREKNNFCTKIDETVQKIMLLKSVASVIIDSGAINVITNNIYCQNVETKKYHFLGKFAITIRIITEKIRDDTITVSSLSHAWQNATSHIRVGGDICFGDYYSKIIADAYANADFYMVVFHMIKFLKSYTPKDSLDIINHFPEADDEQLEEAKKLGYRLDIPVTITH